MVSGFFDRVLKANPLPSNYGEAKTSDSVASAMPAASGTKGKAANVDASKARPGMTWEQVRTREGVADDGRVRRDMFKGPAPLFERLDTNHDGALSKEDFDAAVQRNP